LFSGGAGSYFRAGLKKIRAGAEISREGCPRPNMESLLVCRGVLNVLHIPIVGSQDGSLPHDWLLAPSHLVKFV
jgi:hypothetical protein